LGILRGMSQRRHGKGGGAAEAVPPAPPPPPVAAGARGAGGAAGASAPDACEAPSDVLLRDCQTALSCAKRNTHKARSRAKALVAAHPDCSLAHRTLVLTHLMLAEDLSGAAAKMELAAAVAAAHAAVQACRRCLHCCYARVYALYTLADSVCTFDAIGDVVTAAHDAQESARTLQCGKHVLEQELCLYLENTRPAVWKAVYELQLHRCARRAQRWPKPVPCVCAHARLTQLAPHAPDRTELICTRRLLWAQNSSSPELRVVRRATPRCCAVVLRKTCFMPCVCRALRRRIKSWGRCSASWRR
jgi:hypothetical protein